MKHKTYALFCQYLFAATACFSAMTECWAGRPLVTEDAGVLANGECELEAFAARAKKPDVGFRSGQFGCGIGLHTQLAAGATRERIEGVATNGAALNGKTFLQELTDEQTGITVAYTLAGTKPRGERLKQEATEIKAVVTIPHNDWLLHLNAGWAHTHAEDSNRTIWAFAVERLNAVGPLDLMGEVFGDDREAPWLQLAARWTAIPERLYLDASWGVQTNGAHTRQTTLGLKVKF